MECILPLLRKLGMRSTYSGYRYLASGIELVLSNPNYRKNVTRSLYSDIGKQYGVSSACVEAAIRNMITSYWNDYQDTLLAALLNYRLIWKPTSSELIFMLSDYLCESQNLPNY